MSENEQLAGGASVLAPQGTGENGGEEGGVFSHLGRLVSRSFQERPLLSWLVVLLLVLVLLLRVVLPLVDYLDQVRRDTAELKESLASYQRLIRKRRGELARRRARLDKLEQQARRLPRLAPEEARRRLLQASRALLERSGLNLLDSRALPGRGQGRFLRVALGLRAQGGYQGIKKFLAAASRAPGFLHLARFQVFRTPGGRGGPLRLECEVADLVRR